MYCFLLLQTGRDALFEQVVPPSKSWTDVTEQNRAKLAGSAL